MPEQRLMFGFRSRRTLALLGCVVLLYLACGGLLLHHHTGGPETVCPVCHSVHTPALAVDYVDLLSQPQQAASTAYLPAAPAPLDSFALHRASRAPPCI